MTATRTGLRLTALGIILLLGAVTLPATHAQDSNKPTPAEGVTHLRDILVTAQKREQLIQDVPLPVTAFDADGAAVQNTVRFDRRSHDFSVNNDGFLDTRIHILSTRLDWAVALGNGTVTNIFGWRDAQADALSSVDELASTTALRNLETLLRAEQFSNELRYTGVFFDRLQLVTGLYYFTNASDYHERRKLADDPPGRARVQNGGGLYDVDTLGVFMAGDYDLTNWLTLTAGLRYSREEKEADVTTLKREAQIQDVPVSITAFDAEQLDALKLRDLGDLTLTMPNVSLDDIGLARGFANFSIRGLGINSSIPSIDPTVGVFVDGIYLGTNAGVLYDALRSGQHRSLARPARRPVRAQRGGRSRLGQH